MIVRSALSKSENQKQGGARLRILAPDTIKETKEYTNVHQELIRLKQLHQGVQCHDTPQSAPY